MDKAARAALLTAAGILDKARARTAVHRAGGQIAPSKYLPNVPRAVHAGGGRENGDTGGMNLYRGTNDSGESITGGIGEGLLFGTPHEDVARLYGDQISQFELPSHARVLTEGTGEFSQITGRKKGPLLRSLRQGENLRDAANEAIARAKEAGYDAVHFNSMRDMGVAVINPSIVVKKADGGRENGQVVNLGKEKLVRSITKAVADVKSGAHQENMDRRAYKLHESGHLPLPIGTKVTPPQGWDMPSELHIHGYWQDVLHPDQHGYKLKSENGDVYEVQHQMHSGQNPYVFGGGFKAYSGPVRNRAGYSDEAMASKNPILPTRTPEQSAQLNKEYDQLFGNDPDITKADGGRIGYENGGMTEEEMKAYMASQPPVNGAAELQAAMDSVSKAGRIGKLAGRATGIPMAGLLGRQLGEAYAINRLNKAGGGDVEGDDDGITAYHGSAYDFPQFDIGKLGTGTGHQAYGHGLYFAGDENDAKNYREMLKNNGSIDIEHESHKLGIPLDRDAQADLRSVSRNVNGDPAAAARALQARNLAARAMPQEKLADLIDMHRKSTSGHMYKVKLNVKPEELLDWNKPLSEQHPNVQAALSRTMPDYTIKNMAGLPHAFANGKMIEVNPNGLTGRDAYVLSRMGKSTEGSIAHQDAKAASEHLLSEGIKGIRYKEGGGYNYVMFHHDPVKVVDKYEYGGTVGKAGGGDVEDDDGITAYHGSPHSFDQFDISKLGTGEGAQAYGHGLYFAGNEEIAKHYRDTLSQQAYTGGRGLVRYFETPSGEVPSAKSAVADIAYSMQKYGIDPANKEGAAWLRSELAARSMGGSEISRADVLRMFKAGPVKENYAKGRMYKVKINAGPHELLDWDKPLSEQHPNIQRIAREADISKAVGPTRGVLQAWREGRDVGVEATGRDLHQAISGYGEHGKQAADYLQSQGLKGIRYRDAGSRDLSDGDPTHNYVMFHHDPVQVVDKYEYGGTVGKEDGGAMIGQHNTSAKGVEVASNIGGIPMPSMAISKVAHPLSGFGDVTLMAHPSMVTPSKETNVWAADTYTGRQPRGEEVFSDPKSVAKAMKADPNFSHMRDAGRWIESANNVTHADDTMKMAQLGLARGIDPKKHSTFYDYVNDVRSTLGANAYDNDHMPGLRAYGDIKRVLYPKEMYTPSGNLKKPVNYTLDAVMKHMKGSAESGTEGWARGAGMFRAVNTPKFSNMADVKADRGLIIPKEQMKPIKSEFEDSYSKLVEQLVKARGRTDFRAYDEAADALTDIAKGRKADWFGAVPPELVAQIKELGRHASKMPTEYFEAKSKKAIPLSAFPAALVPKEQPETARRLTEAGVKNVMTYGSPEEKLALYRSKPDLMFKNGGKAKNIERALSLTSLYSLGHDRDAG